MNACTFAPKINRPSQSLKKKPFSEIEKQN